MVSYVPGQIYICLVVYAPLVVLFAVPDGVYVLSDDTDNGSAVNLRQGYGCWRLTGESWYGNNAAGMGSLVRLAEVRDLTVQFRYLLLLIVVNCTESTPTLAVVMSRSSSRAGWLGGGR